MGEKTLESINAKMNNGHKVAVVPTSELQFLEKNARFMKNETFQNLVENIKKDGGLSQFPFCYLQEDGKYKVLSGNHRASAAIAAGLTEIPVIYTDKPMTNDEQIAVQISHNSISGEDDPIILQELYAEIQDLDMKYYSGLDDKALDQLEKVQIDGITEAQLDYLSVSFLFLPEEKDELIEAFNEAKGMITNETVLARYKDFDRLLQAQSDVQAAYDIHNGATSMMLVLDVFKNHIEDIQTGYIDSEGEATHNKFVPISSVIGTDSIPAGVAAQLKKAVDRAVSKEEITTKNKWQLIEYLVADYLAGE